jgi:hypothetical protein
LKALFAPMAKLEKIEGHCLELLACLLIFWIFFGLLGAFGCIDFAHLGCIVVKLEIITYFPFLLGFICTL